MRLKNEGGGTRNSGRTVTVAPRKPGGLKPAKPKSSSRAAATVTKKVLKPKAPAKSKGPSKPSKGKAPNPNAMSGAEKRAIARENKAKKAAADKYLHQADNLTLQANAIRDALKTQFAAARDQNLGDINQNLNQIISQLKEGHEIRAQSFLASAKDSEKATADTQEGALSNLVRERQDSMTAILEQGAGETDSLRAMVMAARNWHANAGEANRSYFDSLQSVNAGIADLNIDTKTSMGNAFMSAEGQKEQVWQDFYDRRSEGFTQLGNVLGQKAEYLASAKEMGAKVKKSRTKSVEDNMAEAFKDAAAEAGKSYQQEGLPGWVTDFQGQAQLKGEMSNSNLAAAPTFEPTRRAEGAGLRTWAA